MGFVEWTEIPSRIAAGVIHGATAVNLNGFNGTPTTTFRTIWDNSNAYVFLTTNMSSPTIVSSSANDAAAGTGARTVRITGVDSTYTAQTENVTLNGVTPVALTKNYMTINSIVVLTAGSGGVTAGTLTLAAAGTTHGFVAAGRNQSTSYLYCTPANFGLLIYNFQVVEEAASVGGGRAQILTSTNGAVSISQYLIGIPASWSSYQEFNIPLYIPPKTQLQAQILLAAATAGASAFSNCVLIDRNIGDNTTNVAQTVAKWI